MTFSAPATATLVLPMTAVTMLEWNKWRQILKLGGLQTGVACRCWG